MNKLFLQVTRIGRAFTEDQRQIWGNRLKPRYWVFPSPKWETKEVKSRAGAETKLGVKNRSKGRGKARGCRGTSMCWVLRPYTFTQDMTGQHDLKAPMLGCSAVAMGLGCLGPGPSRPISKSTPTSFISLFKILLKGEQVFYVFS